MINVEFPIQLIVELPDWCSEWDKQHGLRFPLPYHKITQSAPINMQNRSHQLTIFIALFILSAICGSAAVLHCAPHNSITSHNCSSITTAIDCDDLNFQKKSPSEKIALAKQRLNLTQSSEGLLEWCPVAVIIIKQNFEENVTHKLVVCYVYGFSPFLSRDEFIARCQEKYAEYELAKKAALGKLDFDDWYATKIIRAFGLPKDTSQEQAWAVYTRTIRIFDGII